MVVGRSWRLGASKRRASRFSDPARKKQEEVIMIFAIGRRSWHCAVTSGSRPVADGRATVARLETGPEQKLHAVELLALEESPSAARSTST
jgi:hypothetical protein